MRTIFATLHSKFIHNSLALPCLAAYCNKNCGEVLIREFTTHEPRESILGLLLEEKPDVVAFSVYLWNRRETLDLVDALHVAKPDVKIILGGPEVSFDGETLLIDHPGITALIHGEGEIPIYNLLMNWQAGRQPGEIPRTTLRLGHKIVTAADGPVLDSLDSIPSPFQNGLTDLSRGFVYYETSRGCPFHCSFCLSALDNRMRSFSMDRIKSDLLLLMENEVPKIKLVDRTFNYDEKRAREIFRFILQHNRCSHFHFEIGAHLLEGETLTLLETVPKDMFQFEIGVQSTLESTLNAINRKVNLEKLEENVRRLVASDRIHIHLDLVAGLPGDKFTSFIDSIDRVIALKPHHLQVEPVKLLPGSPLREQADKLQIRFDPNPPYTIIESPNFSYEELQRLQEISRLLDLTYNSGVFGSFLASLSEIKKSFAKGLVWLAEEWHERNLFRFPMSRQTIYDQLAQIVREEVEQDAQRYLLDRLAYDYARSERVVINKIPDFFDTTLSAEETGWTKKVVQERTELIRGQGIKLQYFACRFLTMDNCACLFLYLTQTGKKMQVEEYRYS